MEKYLREFGERLAMRQPMGRDVCQQIDNWLRELPADGVLTLNFDGLMMMDYSFADEAIGTIYTRLSAGEYPDRYVVLKGGHPDLLENVEVSLKQRSVAALVLPSETTVQNLKSQVGSNWRCIGELPKHLTETLDVVMKNRKVTVRDVAEVLGITSLTALNNRMYKLYQLRLIKRQEGVVPEGGRQYFYVAVV